MLELDKYLNIALFISILLHALLFFPLPYIRKAEIRKAPELLEVTYLITKQEPAKKAALKAKTPAPVQYKEKKPAPAKLTKTLPPKPKQAEAPKKPKSQYANIEIPPELPKEKEDLYVGYYQSIREKIRSYVEKNYTRFIDYGEVCLHFVLLPSGDLKQISIVNERSTNNPQLKEIVKRSLKEAAPFFPFPKGLSSEQLSFNVTVSFEIEE
ncbi:MAG: TonB family protein [Candidatus Omnitrophica bacterium]|nr:TonB family protein [Candidatus Omnitrophota bacterium]